MTFKEPVNSENEVTQINFKSQLKILLKEIDELQQTITDKWLDEYRKKEVMKIKFIPVKRQNALIGEYKTKILEITLSNNKVCVINPIFSITNLKFRFEFYLVDDPFDKNIIINKRINDGENKWEFYKSSNPANHFSLTKIELENIITNWFYKIN